MAPALRNTSRRVATATKTVTSVVASKTVVKDAQKPCARTSPPSVARDKVSAMLVVNATLQMLSNMARSGPDVKSTAVKVDKAIEDSKKALTLLRNLCPEDLDVERAACSLVGKLLLLDRCEQATNVLDGLHEHLTLLMSGSARERKSVLCLLSLPLLAPQNATITTIAFTALAHAITALAYLLLRSPVLLGNLVSTFWSGSTLLDWLQHLHWNCVPEKSKDALLTRAYTALTKACSTLSSSTSTPTRTDLDSLFYLRTYAISCLLYTSPETIKPSTFWEQVSNACLFHARTSIELSSTNAKARNDILPSPVSQTLRGLVQRVQSLSLQAFLEGAAFLGVCDIWMTIAKREADMATLDHISGLMAILKITLPSHAAAEKPLPSMSTSPSTAVEGLITDVKRLKLVPDGPHTMESISEASSLRKKVMIECTQLCTTFVKTMASLQVKDPNIVHRIEEAIGALARYQSMMPQLTFASHKGQQFLLQDEGPAPSLGEDADVARVYGKVVRVTERLRRAALRALDSGTAEKLDDQTRIYLINLLEGIIEILRTNIKECQRPSNELAKDNLTSLLDTIFVIARVRLDSGDVESCAIALRQLEHATTAVEGALPVINVRDGAEYLRCVSGAFHNCGGSLFKASKYGLATRFLKEGCDVGLRSYKLHIEMRAAGETKGGGQNDKNTEVWKQLEEQLFRRYELLSVCYTKIGDRKLAHQALLQSVRTFPYARFPTVTGADPLNNSAGALRQLASVIERLTYMATCELFLPPSGVSLRSVFEGSVITTCLPACTDINSSQLNDMQLQAAITGTLLTHQLDILEALMHKDGVRDAMVCILQDLLVVYDSKWSAVRRARAILSLLRILWKDDNIAHKGGEGIHQWNAQTLGCEVLTLLEQRPPPADSCHASLVQEYFLSVHLWLSLHAYRQSPSGSDMACAVATHIEKACQTLAGFHFRTERVTGERSPKVKNPDTIISTRKITKGNSIKKALAVDPKSRNSRKTVPVTPRSKKEELLLDSPDVALVKTGGETKRTSTILDVTVVAGLLQMNIHLLGLLGLTVLKIKLLETSRRLFEHQDPIPMEVYSELCIGLAHEYIKVGWPKRAGLLFSRCAGLLRGANVSNESRLRHLLGQAEVLALGDNISASTSLYCEAHALENMLVVEDKTVPTVQRIRMRADRLERTALACRVFAAIRFSKDDVVGALHGMLQSLRLWNRAVDALSRLGSLNTLVPRVPQTDANPFESSESITANNQPVSPSPTTRPAFMPLDAISWRLLSCLLSMLLSLSQIFFARGSSREALYFSQQALDLAETTKASIVAARALMIRSEILLGQGQLTESKALLDRAGGLLEGLPGIDSANVRMLWGDYGVMCEGVTKEQEENAKESYDGARKMLDEFEEMLAVVHKSRRRSSIDPVSGTIIVNPGQGMVGPKLLSSVLRRHIWLLRNEGDALFRQLIDRLMSLPPTAEIKGEEHAVIGKLTMHNARERFQADIFLNSLTESTIALPMLISGGRDLSLVSTTQDILNALGDAEKHFWADLTLTSQKGNVPHVREAMLSLGIIQVLQSALGRMVADESLLATRLLDASSAITLHREMLETIQYKLLDTSAVDDLQWPLLKVSNSPSPSLHGSCSNSNLMTQQPIRAPSASSLSSVPDSAEPSPTSDTAVSYWATLQERYTTPVLLPSTAEFSSSDFTKLPPNWTVVHIILTPDKSSILLNRFSSASPPLLFSLPLRNRCDGDGSHLTLDEALAEMCEIVRLNDDGARRAVHVRNDDTAERATWWSERMALDKRLKELLDNIEFCWLGGFKTILSTPLSFPPGSVNDLQGRVDKVLERVLSSSDTKKRQAKVTTNPAASIPRLSKPFLDCLASLSPSCRNEELEDLLCFILDLYQLHGFPVTISEVDMDQAIVDLRSALSEFHAVYKQVAKKGNVIEDYHTFLVLDRCLQGIPWESIPVLRGRSISRIPSLSFLLDRVHLAAWQKRARVNEDGHEDAGKHDHHQGRYLPDRICVDPRKTYYVLNPSGDLRGTEGRFASWLKQMHKVGWDGIMGHAPSEQQLLNALSQKDLLIYFGHGGGEQYIRPHKVRHLLRCAATMLWGCSSGSVKDMGEFDRVGTPYHYMLAGCPTLVANLWDVTDRDIDKFTQGVFDRLRLTPDIVRCWQRDHEGQLSGMSVVAAVAQSRQLCKLKYLTGAAPVVYGIPFYL